ncbi:hypothetical protein [Roseinatronobacter alkalisoli]|uniref:Tat pathway signal sequence domain protein n=1 Tax=Roseinatronobacter alkalisoli TaxID=3028235 RepID=A0ABT5TA31_9RHOB|nr:hypothetical protein [Roseinatronobacter sp. HJB301]MDD7971952.1 hypothetical protein [Roseinatronobacter sp. HJB301]
MPLWSRCLVTLSAALLAISPAVTPAAAQEAGEFRLELNNLEPVDNGCRLTFVAFNATGIELAQTSYDVAVFDDTGAVSERLILEFGHLPEDKTRVVQFLLNRGCDQISRLLLNEAEECLDAAGQSSRICMEALSASSRADVIFGS